MLGFVLHNNEAKIGMGQPPFRFADLYHSANRTPTSEHSVSRRPVVPNVCLIIVSMFKENTTTELIMIDIDMICT